MMLTQEYIFNSARPSPGECSSHDALIRDCLAGNERMKNNASQYVRRPDGMNTQAWANYLKGSHFTGYAYATLLSWAGCANRKPHLIETDGMKVPFRLGYHDLDEQHLVQHAIYNVFAYGRIAYFCDPGGAIVPYYPTDEIEIKCEGGKLVKAVFQENDDRRIDLAIVDEIAQFQWSNNEGVGEGYRALIVNGKPIHYLPIIFINAADLQIERSLSPLYEIASLSTKVWDHSLAQSQSLWLTASPQPVVMGISSEKEIPTALGPSAIWVFSNPEAKCQLLTYSGDGISDRAKEIARIEQQMSALGANVLLQKSAAHTVSRTVELNTRASASDLVLILRNLSDGLTILLRYLAEQNGKDLNKVFVRCNEDLLDSQMQADLLRALNEARRDGSLSFSTWVDILKAGELLPATLDADEEMERIMSDPTTILGQASESDMLDGGDGYIHKNKPAGEVDDATE